jgi:hypothetical protein
MDRSVAGLVVLSLIVALGMGVALAPVAQAEPLHAEDTGHPNSVRANRDDVPLDHIDILHVQATLHNGTLEATLRVAAPIPSDLPGDRVIDYLILVDHSPGNHPAFGFGDWDASFRCSYHNGSFQVAECQATGTSGAVQSVVLDGDRIHIQATLPVAGVHLHIGAATVQYQAETQSSDGFDFSDRADPLRDQPDLGGGHDDHQDHEDRAGGGFGRSALLFLAAAVGVGYALWYQRRKQK